MISALWWDEARAKLKDALAALKCNRYSATCFWAQQAAELALKAMYLKHKAQSPPRVHDLLVLVKDLGAPDQIKVAAAALNPAYTSARYVDVTSKPPSKYYSKADAQQSIVHAKEVLKWCMSHMK